MVRATLSLGAVLMIALTGCSNEFPLTPRTGISGSQLHLSSAQAQIVTDAQGRLAGELTQRTGWEWEVGPQFFRSTLQSGAPKGTIFFMHDHQLAEGAFSVVVTPESVLVKASSSKGFNSAIDALLGTLRRRDDALSFPAQTLSSAKSLSQ